MHRNNELLYTIWMITDAKSTVAVQRVRAALEEAIACGDFAPGEKLDEATLAARFSVSRTPIREALRELAMAGQVELRPHRGALVANADPALVYEMFEVMAEIEAMAARLAARRLTREGAAELQVAQARCMAKIGDPDAYYAANEEFHQIIYALSGNTFLAQQCLALQSRLRVYRRLQLRVPNRIAASAAEHEAVILAMIEGQGDVAADALKAHVRVQGARFSDLVAMLAAISRQRSA